MPTYEYLCTSCAHEWEFEQSIKDEPVKDCPACHTLSAKRQISRGNGFILKGGGWYSDLYGSSSNKSSDSSKAEKGESKATDANAKGGEAKAASGSDAKSDTKPD